MPRLNSISRRTFLANSGKAAAAVGIGAVAAQSARAAQRKIGANDRIVLGTIGVGGQGTHDTNVCLSQGNVVCAMACDVAEFRLENAKAVFSKTMENKGHSGIKIDTTDDYRRLLDRKDIDAVIIATPDLWHFIPFMAAVDAGKHIYQEKPMCFTIDQGIQMVKAAKSKPELTVQIGTQRRSGTHYLKAKELIDNGFIGDILYVRAKDCRNYLAGKDPFAPRPYKGKIDWDKFQAPVPAEGKVPFDEWRYFAWRWFWEYAGGLVTDVGVHVMDLTHMLTGKDTPKSVVCNGGVYALKYWHTPDIVNAVWDYGTHTVVFTSNFANGHEGDGATFYGTKGTIDIRGTYIRVYQEGDPLKTVKEFGPEGPAHQHNWLDCIRSGKTPNAPVELGFSSLLPSLMANIAYRTGKKVSWDPAAQKVVMS